MQKIPQSNAEARYEWAPFKTWAACAIIGAVITLIRNLLYGIPFVPIAWGMFPFMMMFAIGAGQAVIGLAYLAIRRRLIDEEGRSRF